MMSKNFFQLSSLIAISFLVISCGNSQVKNDCNDFKKGFIEGCNERCSISCTDYAVKNQIANKTRSEIEGVCKDSCKKHCNLQFEKINPPECQ